MFIKSPTIIKELLNSFYMQLIDVILISFLFVSGLSAQSCFEEVSERLHNVLISKNLEVELLDMSDNVQLKFIPDSSKYIEFENDYVEKDRGYIYFNKSKIKYFYIGFYLEYDPLWETNTLKFIINLPEAFPCAHPSKVFSSYVNRPLYYPIELGEILTKTKCAALEYVINQIELECVNLSERAWFESLGFRTFTIKENTIENSYTKICECYKLLTNEVKNRNLDFSNTGITGELQNLFVNLKKSNGSFNACTTGVYANERLFTKSRIKNELDGEISCIDKEVLSEILKYGPDSF